MTQASLFHDQEIQRLVEGKEICHECGRRKRAYAKTMDKRLVAVLLKAVNYCEEWKKLTFDVLDVYGDSERLRADFRKLHYWNIVRSTGKYRKYEITQFGWKFVLGDVKVPKIVHVWKDEVILRGPEDVAIFEVEPRWQQMKSDYTLDYLPFPFIKPKMIKLL